MDIVVIAEFCDDFSKQDNGRFLYLAKMLSLDNNVELITSSFDHTTKSHRIKAAVQWPFKITFLDEPGYPRNVCLKRFYSHYQWGRSLLRYMKKRNKPDVVYIAVPSLSGPFRIAKLCQKRKVRFIIDIQDLWPEAFEMVFRVPLVSSLVFLPFKIIANGIYKRADVICAVSETYVKRAQRVNSKWESSTAVYLGTDLDTFDQFSKTSLEMSRESVVKLVYCGTLGNSYDLLCVMDAMRILNNQNLQFIVMGDGPKKEEFQHYAEKNNLNVLFLGRLKYDRMCAELTACDITVNPIMPNAAQSIINKHADYAASGLPVINTQESCEYRELVDRYEMGFNCNNGDAKDLADKLKLLISDKELRVRMGNNARRCAEEQFDRKKTYNQLCSLILK